VQKQHAKVDVANSTGVTKWLMRGADFGESKVEVGDIKR
jgi:hypothetical protein